MSEQEKVELYEKLEKYQVYLNDEGLEEVGKICEQVMNIIILDLRKKEK